MIYPNHLQSFHQSVHEPHQDLSHFRLCEVSLACSHLQHTQVCYDRGSRIAHLDILNSVRTYVIGARQLLVTLGTVLRQRLDLSAEAAQGSGIETLKCLLFH